MVSISALATDLYEYLMAGGYFVHGMTDVWATFELFVRRMPENRNYLISCGQEVAFEFIENFRLQDDEVEFLRSLPVFKPLPDEFYTFLRKLKFSGDVWALPEGTVVFPGEPIIRVTAPIIEAQLLETALLATVNHSTAIASKSARVVSVARGKPVVEFGSRRAHGTQAAMLGARACYIAGCVGTSNLEAGKEFKIPVYGTVAHSWVQAFDNELEAFQANISALPTAGVMLIDTYDTIQGAKNAVKLGESLKSVRIDSGDLIKQAKEVRKILNDAGLKHVTIFLSGDLDEYRIDEILRAKSPADAFGVGTRMTVSVDEPVVNGVYKLVEVIKKGKVSGRVKLSTDKILYPGRKQTFRYIRNGKFVRDVIGIENEKLPGHPFPQMVQVFKRGKRIRAKEPLEKIRDRVRSSMSKLPKRLLILSKAKPYPVSFSKSLECQLRIAQIELVK